MFLPRLFLIICYVTTPGQPISDQEMNQLIPDNYRTARPLSGVPINFSWSLRPHGVTDLSAKKMEFTVDLTIFSYWKDDELNITTDSFINVPSQTASGMWYPWLRYMNCQGCQSEIIDPRYDSFSIDGKVVWAIFRKPISFTCLLDLSYYPFDKQKCNIEVRLSIWHAPINMTHADEEEYYQQLHENPVRVPPEFHLYSLERIFEFCENKKQNGSDVCFRYVFVFQRIAVPHILLVFLPSMLIVVLSWISFWLDVNMAAPRVALGLTSLLTLSTQFNSAQQNLPSVATIKALDVWMFACMFMVFASLVVYAFSYTSFRLNKLQDQKPTATDFLRRKPKNKIASKPKKLVGNLIQKFKVKRENFRCIGIDKAARVVFPVIFTIFNIYYWTTYLK